MILHIHRQEHYLRSNHRLTLPFIPQVLLEILNFFTKVVQRWYIADVLFLANFFERGHRFCLHRGQEIRARVSFVSFDTEVLQNGAESIYVTRSASSLD